MSLRLPGFGPAQMVLAIALLLLGLFLYAMAQTAVQAHRLGAHEREVFAEVEQLRRQQAELQGLLTYLKSDEYVEGFARQQFGYVKPGETLVEVTAPAAEKGQRRPGDRWWEAAFDVSAADLGPSPAPAKP
ncbi:MAG: septum formation initiator family protein [Dehalococcoidia bacterium]|nr:MAG: septum formation initiator family protein [Dehalococcoidia bacterium]